jgi:uncharacterized protein (AIM24 family)
MSSVVIAGNTSGTITLDAPNVAGTTVLTLPTTSGTIALSGGAVSGTTGSFSGDLSFNSGYGSAAVAYGCRAWVNFNGTGTVAIRASGNVSSITDNGSGTYTVNFTTALTDTNYAAVSMAGQYGGGVSATLGFNLDSNTRTTTAYGIYSVVPNSPTSTTDIANVTMAFFR